MTKPVTSIAALQLVEAGRLDLDAPVSAYCPEFADIRVLGDVDGEGGTAAVPSTPVTVRHLLTHTSGFGYWFFDARLRRWHQTTGAPNVNSGRREALRAPLLSEPGTAFRYGINTDWLGQVIEAVTGSGLDVVIGESVTGPLGMYDTSFRAPGPDSALVSVQTMSDDGGWERIGFGEEPPAYCSGGQGLYSTPLDYVRFQRLLLSDGSFEGERLLEAATLEAAFSNQIGDLDFPELISSAEASTACDFAAGSGFKFGFGFLLNQEDVPGHRGAGSGAWAGLLNTQFWVDRDRGITGALYSQFLPFAQPAALDLYDRFEVAAYALEPVA